jgi:hypothetical protein
VLGGQLALFLQFGVGTDATQVDQNSSANPSSKTVSGLIDAAPGTILGWAFLAFSIPLGSTQK